MQAVFVQVNEATMNHNIRIETGVIMDQEFWKDKKVLITGNNGFKGCWLNKWLDMMGADTLGISLPAEKESIYHELRMSERHCYQELDIRNYNMLEQAVKKFRPEIVFHLAAQAIVRTAKEEPVETFSANLMGTVNLLEALRHCDSIRAAVVVTSDKVYENTDEYIAFTEESKLGGNEPYSASKACQELAVRAYRDTYFAELGVGLATARASNTFGGGDHHFDRLLPYLMKASYEKQPIRLRNPEAIRPWQYIPDLLHGYIRLAECLYQNPVKYAQGYNFGPAKNDLFTVGEIAALLQPEHSTETQRTFCEANILMINSNKSRKELNWRPVISVKEGMKRTEQMYQAYFGGKSIDSLISEELKNYYEE